MEYLAIYIVFTYLYMGARIFSKVSKGVPSELLVYREVTAALLAFLFAISPISFIFHIIKQAKDKFS